MSAIRIEAKECKNKKKVHPKKSVWNRESKRTNRRLARPVAMQREQLRQMQIQH